MLHEVGAKSAPLHAYRPAQQLDEVRTQGGAPGGVACPIVF
ncbi:hypothetical protein RQM47_11985 [Rubrivirga sp. S365]|nr:hypothetical protein [Rubrivirga sp. S365]MDT7857362.1 hypothetical protein [Rubrivirga sp. S365]